MRNGVLGMVVIAGLVTAAVYLFHDDNQPPVHLTAPSEPYKVAPPKEDADSGTVASDSMVHAVLGGDAKQDPSMQNLKPPPPIKPAGDSVTTDVPTGFSVPKDDNP